MSSKLLYKSNSSLYEISFIYASTNISSPKMYFAFCFLKFLETNPLRFPIFARSYETQGTSKSLHISSTIKELISSISRQKKRNMFHHYIQN